MAKGKSKKKSKGKRSKGVNAHDDNAGSSFARDDTGDSQSIFWSTAEECAYYASLGCHIANIARCIPSTKHKSKQKSKKGAASSSTIMPSNTCSEYEEMYMMAMQQYPWILGIERFDPGEYHPGDIENIPEIAMDDGGDDEGGHMTLTVTNVTKNTTNVCFVTVYDVDVCDANGRILKSGISSIITSSNNKDSTTTTKERKCTTFIVICPPQTFVHLCSLAPDQTERLSGIDVVIPITSWSQIEIETDVQPWSFHPNVDDEHPYLLHFPFCSIGEDVSDETDDSMTSAFQCTQSEDGQLTHFFHGNYHAVDFACPVGTPLYSPADGVVVDVRDHNNNADVEEDCNGDNGNKYSVEPSKVAEVSGIAAGNLFYWNSIMIRVVDDGGNEDADPLFIEFVHIQSNSCVVQVGDAVRRGQLLCRSGSVGFTPDPHLHLAAYRSNENDAATVRVRFECCGGSSSGEDSADHDAPTDGREEGKGVASFLPRAGGWYNQNGLVKQNELPENSS